MKQAAIYFALSLLIVLTYTTLPFFRQHYHLIEPVACGCISLLCIFFIRKHRLTLNSFEATCLLFFVYITAKDIAINAWNINSTMQAFLLIAIYYSFKSLSASRALAVSLLLTAFCCIPNKSIFAILLASQLAFTIPLLIMQNQKQRWFIWTIIACNFALLLTTMGRAGIMGLTVAALFITYIHLPAKSKGKWIACSIPILLLLAAFLFILKPGSSSGRMLIYKISAGMFRENWLWGIGQGQFKVKYNLQQAVYFSSNNINSNEALLADNTFYAFNDTWQVLIEHGAPGFILFAIAIYFLVRRIILLAVNHHDRQTFTAATASLVCIGTAALVSYPLQVFPVQVQFFICLALLMRINVGRTEHASNPKTNILKVLLVCICTITAAYFFWLTYCRAQQQGAFRLSQTGYKKQALEKYSRLSNFCLNDGHSLYLHARELFYAGETGAAQRMLEQAKRYHCTNDVYKLSAEISEELRSYQAAVEDYKTAIYMVPNRMTSRFALFKFYFRRRDTANAACWGRSIIEMPVKVPSALTGSIQKNTKRHLSELMKSP